MAVGYRVGEPQETNAKKLIKFEVVDSGNEPMLDYLAAALKCQPTLESINWALDDQFGSDAIGMWLTDTPEIAEERYGPGEAYSVEIPPDAIVGTDLGPDGKLWIWRKKPLISKIEGQDYVWTQKGREITPPLTQDEYQVLKRCVEEQRLSHSKPKAARGWWLRGLARWAFKWPDGSVWPEGKLYRVMNKLMDKGLVYVHTVRGERGGFTYSPGPRGYRTFYRYEKAALKLVPEEEVPEEAKVAWTEVFKPKAAVPGPTVFVEFRMLKDAPAIIGTDMKVYGPFTAGKVYAVPKDNARAFLKQHVAVATRKEAVKPTLKEMFKGEVLTGYVEAAKVKSLVETNRGLIERYKRYSQEFEAELERLRSWSESLPVGQRPPSYEKALGALSTFKRRKLTPIWNQIRSKVMEDNKTLWQHFPHATDDEPPLYRELQPILSTPNEERRKALLKRSQELIAEIQEERGRG